MTLNINKFSQVNWSNVHWILSKLNNNCKFVSIVSFILFQGVFQSVFYQSSSGEVDIYADGGLVVNYPIFAFDGNL